MAATQMTIDGHRQETRTLPVGPAVVVTSPATRRKAHGLRPARKEARILGLKKPG